MTRHMRWTAAAAALSIGLIAACSDGGLGVANTDQPDVGRILATPDGIDAVLRGSFSAIFDATHGAANVAAGDLTPAAMGIALESVGSVNNYSMNIRATIPRLAIDNSRGNNTSTENFRDFQTLSARARMTGNAVSALDKLVAGGGTLGSASANARGRSFGFLVMGVANGELALMYDSAAVAVPGLGSTEIPPLQGYNAVMTAALAQLDTAINIATAAHNSGADFTIPDTYLPITGGLSNADYIRFIHSMKARFRAGVARNPAERAAVNWNAVLADAQAGITKSIVFNLNNSAGWDYWWLSQMAVGKGWSQMTPYFIGMADTSGGYANWIATDRSQRQPFLILTPDKRFPSGETRAAQNASSPPTSAQLPSIYFRNRPAGEDTFSASDAFTNSFYDLTRFYQYRAGSSIGPWVWYSLPENNLLAAEALMRLGRYPEAVPYVNQTRVANGLEPFPANSDASTRAPAQPGGSATDCVPRTPTGAGGTLECGTLFEAMKYEKRIETLFTGYNAWFTENRGWGDLPVGSAEMWPVPYQEMDARLEPYYNSLTGPQWVAATNTYGFGVGTK